MSDTHGSGSARWPVPTAEQRTLVIASAWLGEHGGRHVKLSTAEVRWIVFRLLDAGVEPTIQGVRTVNGGHGCSRVIGAGIRDFFARMNYSTYGSSPVLSTHAVQRLRTFWLEAIRCAHQLERIEVTREPGGRDREMDDWRRAAQAQGAPMFGEQRYDPHPNRHGPPSFD